MVSPMNARSSATEPHWAESEGRSFRPVARNGGERGHATPPGLRSFSAASEANLWRSAGLKRTRFPPMVIPSAICSTFGSERAREGAGEGFVSD